MGTSDKIWFKISCDSCGTSETVTARDKGSMWSGPSWTSIDKPGTFSIREKLDQGEPAVQSATCNSCGKAAEVKSSYGLTRPEGF